ncbi:MAG: hypothetical protein LBH74_09460 [Nitrososphaerota archaeon]|jgi:hypothetical protein|nr:hypothetical protein [Nitrososphaerota archaeon]
MKSWRNNKINFCNWIYTPDEITQDMPAMVNKWLAELMQLREVPFTYLVADERLLPMESIRFFCIDPHWLDSLIAGATSIGVHTVCEAERNVGLTRTFLKETPPGLQVSRNEKMHPNHLDVRWYPNRRRHISNYAAITDETALTGFLMRSDLVTNWKGIEIKGFNGETPLKILRLEVVSDKVLICIFAGILTSVQMFEPSESLHFGANKVEGHHTIYLRRIDEGYEGQILENKAKRVLIVPTELNGRINVAKLSEDVAGKLGETRLESSQFALEMLSIAGKCTFIVSKDPTESV